MCGMYYTFILIDYLIFSINCTIYILIDIWSIKKICESVDFSGIHPFILSRYQQHDIQERYKMVTFSFYSIIVL